MKIFKKSAIFIFLIFIFLSILSCGYSAQDAECYLPGRYVYKIPSGETQILTISSDFNFDQVVYQDHEIIYTNSGKMYVNGNKIEFEHWLECYEDDEQVMLKKPDISYSMGHYWKKLKNNEIHIVMFDQTNYIFKKRK